MADLQKIADDLSGLTVLEAAELAKIRGQREAIKDVAIQKKCGFSFQAVKSRSS